MKRVKSLLTILLLSCAALAVAQNRVVNTGTASRTVINLNDTTGSGTMSIWEQLEQERIAQEKAEQLRQQQEQAEREAAEKARLEREEQERIAAEQRLQQEKAEQERLAAEKARQKEQERIAAEQRAQQEKSRAATLGRRESAAKRTGSARGGTPVRIAPSLPRQRQGCKKGAFCGVEKLVPDVAHSDGKRSIRPLSRVRFRSDLRAGAYRRLVYKCDAQRQHSYHGDGCRCFRLSAVLYGQAGRYALVGNDRRIGAPVCAGVFLCRYRLRLPCSVFRGHRASVDTPVVCRCHTRTRRALGTRLDGEYQRFLSVGRFVGYFGYQLPRHLL